MKKYTPERKSAVALKYDEVHDTAPKVVAKGQGFLAEEILNRAQEHDIPIHQDKTLITLMQQLELNESIPEELYQAVAEVFAYIYRVDKNST